jgi:hypothetical protein
LLQFFPSALSMIWQTTNRIFDLSRRGLIMGILNVTTDSFSDGGKFIDVERAVAHAQQLAAEGAEIIDVGGESTRPGASPVSEAEEMRRVLPVIARLTAGHPNLTISVDTMKPAVARAAVEHGAAVINDVTGLRDPAMREVVRVSGVGAIAMHMQGGPRDMQHAPQYADVLGEIREFALEKPWNTTSRSFATLIPCGSERVRSFSAFPENPSSEKCSRVTRSRTARGRRSHSRATAGRAAPIFFGSTKRGPTWKRCA